ncbi:MAG: putative intracellular protease/amidase [Kiritimatiellia bacterium]|jgi:putative intracellular protease/amidase
MARVIIALAERDFDPTEAAVPWSTLSEAGHDVRFATESGAVAACDPKMLTGVLLGQVKATPENAARYAKMIDDPRYLAPLRFADLVADDFDLLVLPGGHAQGMRQYLESTALQRFVVAAFDADLLVGSICHGGVVLARSQRNNNGVSVISGRRVTALPRRFERGAWMVSKPFYGDYFRTYPEWVQDEVEAALGASGSFEAGPVLPVYSRAFVVQDGNLITARWPGDAALFSDRLVEALAKRSGEDA